MISRLQAIFELESKSVYDGIISRCRDVAIIYKDSRSLERLDFLSSTDPEGRYYAGFFLCFLVDLPSTKEGM